MLLKMAKGMWCGRVTGVQSEMVCALCLAVSPRFRDGATESVSVMGKRAACHPCAEAVKAGRNADMRRCCSMAGEG